jgi:hypothetical protein
MASIFGCIYLAIISFHLFSSNISHHEHTRAVEHLRLSIAAITRRWFYLWVIKRLLYFLASDDDGIQNLGWPWEWLLHRLSGWYAIELGRDILG